eukprot:c15172_g1_i3.p1 GENE.c15172_g1_i3~~c15172_g1_i3.p1  ORF type:complete len:263 (-),score=50.79 c15172_g1_i3:40-828(-)
MRLALEMIHLDAFVHEPLSILVFSSYWEKFLQSSCKQPPSHMKSVRTRLTDLDMSPSNESESDEEDNLDTEQVENFGQCFKCDKSITEDSYLECSGSLCVMRSHVVCLALAFLPESSPVLHPSEGTCPACSRNLVWTELIDRCTSTGQTTAVSLSQFSSQLISSPMSPHIIVSDDVTRSPPLRLDSPPSPFMPISVSSMSTTHPPIPRHSLSSSATKLSTETPGSVVLISPIAQHRNSSTDPELSPIFLFADDDPPTITLID